MRFWPFYLTKLVCWIVLRAGFGLDVRGQGHVPRRGGCLIASNHVSYLDPVVVGVSCPRPVGFMARQDLFGHWLLGLFMRAVRVIPIQRDEGDRAAMRQAIRRLAAGEVIAIFPEGARQPSGRLGRAKRGVGLLAADAGVPIVPVVVTGTFGALPPTSRRLRRAKIRVAFGEPIPYTKKFASEATDSSERARPRAARLRHEALARVVTDRWRRLAQEGHGEPGTR